MKRILVAEDEKLLREMLVRFLTEDGFTVSCAADGEEAVHRALRERPDLVLMDLEMPRVTGLEAIRRLKGAGGAVSRIPVIVLTGHAARDAVVSAIQAGATDFLVKGDIQMDRVRVKIDRALGLKGLPPGRLVAPAPAPREAATPQDAPGDGRAPLTRGEVEARLGRIQDFKAMPFVVTEIIQMTGGRSATAMQLADVIMRDAALTARILRVANSAFYVERGRVQTLIQAIGRIGFRGVREIAMAISLISAYPPRTVRPGRLRLWRHSLACAALAREMAVARGRKDDDVEEAFLAGLLHDVGAVILDEHVRPYREDAEPALPGQGRKPLIQVEKEWFGLDHAETATRVLQKWRFSEPLVAGVALHHVSWGEVLRWARAGADLAGLIRIGDILAKAARVGADGDARIEPIPDEALATLGLKPDRIRAACRDLERRVGELAQVFFLHEDESLWQEAADPAPLGMGADVLLLHEKRPLMDPVEIFLEALDLKPSVIRDFKQDWAARQPVRLVIRGESPAWLSSQADQLEAAARKHPDVSFDRTLLLTSHPLGDDPARRFSSLGATVLEIPTDADVLREALQV